MTVFRLEFNYKTCRETFQFRLKFVTNFGVSDVGGEST